MTESDQYSDVYTRADIDRLDHWDLRALGRALTGGDQNWPKHIRLNGTTEQVKAFVIENLLDQNKLGVEVNGKRYVAGSGPDFVPVELRGNCSQEQELALAELFGFEAVLDDKRGHKWCKFNQGDLWAWECTGFIEDGQKTIMWQTAYLRDGRYQEHRKYRTLAKALGRPTEAYEVQVGGVQ